MHRHDGVYILSAAILSVCGFSLIVLSSSIAQQPQDVSEPQGSNSHSSVISSTSARGAHPSYQTCRRPFVSNFGSGHTVWYFTHSNSSIQSPPVISQAKPGHLYIHLDTTTKTHQYWMLAGSGQWETVSKGVEYPHNHDRVLSFHSNGDPSWVLQATIGTMETR